MLPLQHLLMSERAQHLSALEVKAIVFKVGPGMLPGTPLLPPPPSPPLLSVFSVPLERCACAVRGSCVPVPRAVVHRLAVHSAHGAPPPCT